MGPEITIEIGPNGKVQISVNGAKGESCTDLTRFLEEALGEVTDREYTTEYYEVEETQSVRVGRDDGE